MGVTMSAYKVTVKRYQKYTVLIENAADQEDAIDDAVEAILADSSWVHVTRNTDEVEALDCERTELEGV